MKWGMGAARRYGQRAFWRVDSRTIQWSVHNEEERPLLRTL